jgi:hypothetical protein
MQDVINKQKRGDATAKVYPIDNERAWTLAEEVLRSSGAGALEEHRDKRMILTTYVSGTGQTGPMTTYLGVFLEPAEAGTKVTCAVSRGPTDFQMTESRFHALFAEALEPPRPAGALIPCGHTTDCERGTCIEGFCRN